MPGHFTQLECEGQQWTQIQEAQTSSSVSIAHMKSLINPSQANVPAGKLAIATLYVPVSAARGYKNTQIRDASLERSNEEEPTSPVIDIPSPLVGMPPFPRKDSTSALSPVSPTSPKRRGLVSLNSFSNLSNSNSSTSNDYRPKNSIKLSSNGFFVRSENMPSSASNATKALIAAAQAAAQPGANVSVVKLAIWSGNKILAWTELVPGQAAPASISKIHFAQSITALSVNPNTATHTSIDVLIGFSTGDILWFDPITTKYNRYNKASAVTSSPVTSLAWCPHYRGTMSHAGSNALPTPVNSLVFMSCHMDGTVITWTVDKEDPQPNSISIPPPHLWSEAGDIIVETPIPLPNSGDSSNKKSPSPKTNPLQIWRVSKKALTDIAMSPDGRFAATTSDDGRLRIVSLDHVRLLDTYCSYFGGLTCCEWSPDGRFILTGGQDDLVSIWSPAEQRLLARCQGHTSFVTAICFEEQSIGENQKRVPRFASIGEDCRVIFWDLSGAALHRPKTSAMYANKRVSLSSTISLNTLSKKRTLDSQAHLPMEDVSGYAGPIFHPAPPRSEVSLLQPVMASPAADDLLTGISLNGDLVLLTKTGVLRYFGVQDQTSRRLFPK